MSKEVLSIPVFPELTSEQRGFVAESIIEFVSRDSKVETEETVGHEL